jgi:hypothetical protein
MAGSEDHREFALTDVMRSCAYPPGDDAPQAIAVAEEALLQSHSAWCRPRCAKAYCNRTATGLVHTGTQRTQEWLWHAENRLNKPNYRTKQDGLGRAQANS